MLRTSFDHQGGFQNARPMLGGNDGKTKATQLRPRGPAWAIAKEMSMQSSEAIKPYYTGRG
jgi:hypothetical protein